MERKKKRKALVRSRSKGASNTKKKKKSKGVIEIIRHRQNIPFSQDIQKCFIWRYYNRPVTLGFLKINDLDEEKIDRLIPNNPDFPAMCKQLLFMQTLSRMIGSEIQPFAFSQRPIIPKGHTLLSMDWTGICILQKRIYCPILLHYKQVDYFVMIEAQVILANGCFREAWDEKHYELLDFQRTILSAFLHVGDKDVSIVLQCNEKNLELELDLFKIPEMDSFCIQSVEMSL